MDNSGDNPTTVGITLGTESCSHVDGCELHGCAYPGVPEHQPAVAHPIHTPTTAEIPEVICVLTVSSTGSTGADTSAESISGDRRATAIVC
ncbi:Uncharacterised protein [Mycobacteroides abscessus subsp. abscessus]|nr:Uncharacterised protein [Mycobacteroides abscessus subsp. abscessus]